MLVIKKTLFVSLILVSLHSCNFVSSLSNEIDIDFLIQFFKKDPIQRDITATELGYELGSLGDSRGFEKCCLSGDGYEFLHYDEESNNWIELLTNNPKVVNSVLKSIEQHTLIKKNGDQSYSIGEIEIKTSKKEAYNHDLYSVVLEKAK